MATRVDMRQCACGHRFDQHSALVQRCLECDQSCSPHPEEGRTMTTEHTPGPWHVTPSAEYAGSYEVSPAVDGEPDWRYRETEDVAEANARLIAAAPDLLEVCGAIAERYNVDDRMGGLGDWLADVIARARGQEVSR